MAVKVQGAQENARADGSGVRVMLKKAAIWLVVLFLVGSAAVKLSGLYDAMFEIKMYDEIYSREKGMHTVGYSWFTACPWFGNDGRRYGEDGRTALWLSMSDPISDAKKVIGKSDFRLLNFMTLPGHRDERPQKKLGTVQCSVPVENKGAPGYSTHDLMTRCQSYINYLRNCYIDAYNREIIESEKYPYRQYCSIKRRVSRCIIWIK